MFLNKTPETKNNAEHCLDFNNVLNYRNTCLIYHATTMFRKTPNTHTLLPTPHCVTHPVRTIHPSIHRSKVKTKNFIPYNLLPSSHRKTAPTTPTLPTHAIPTIETTTATEMTTKKRRKLFIKGNIFSPFPLSGGSRNACNPFLPRRRLAILLLNVPTPKTCNFLENSSLTRVLASLFSHSSTAWN